MSQSLTCPAYAPLPVAVAQCTCLLCGCALSGRLRCRRRQLIRLCGASLQFKPQHPFQTFHTRCRARPRVERCCGDKTGTSRASTRPLYRELAALIHLCFPTHPPCAAAEEIRPIAGNRPWRRGASSARLQPQPRRGRLRRAPPCCDAPRLLAVDLCCSRAWLG